MHPKFLQFLKDKAGTSLKIRGSSMLPVLHDGDTVTVEPRIPVFGDIALFPQDGVLFVHRVGLSWNGRIMTIGDHQSCPDTPIRCEEIIGIVPGRRSILRGCLAGMRIARTYLRRRLNRLR